MLTMRLIFHLKRTFSAVNLPQIEIQTTYELNINFNGVDAAKQSEGPFWLRFSKSFIFLIILLV